MEEMVALHLTKYVLWIERYRMDFRKGRGYMPLLSVTYSYSVRNDLNSYAE